MKRIITYIAAATLLIGAQALRADDSSTSTPAPAHKESAEGRQNHKNLMKILGLNPKDLKDMEPKERHTKVKEAAEKYVADHKDTASMTAEQKSDLATVKKFLAAGGHKKAKPAESTSN